MNKISYFALLSFGLLIMGVSLANASTTNNPMICKVSHLILSNTLTGPQNPHFMCCSGDLCNMGDKLSKSMNLLPASEYCNVNCTFKGRASINVYNFDGLDHTTISLSVTHLFPRKGIFRVWLVDDNDQSKNVELGMFKTTLLGGGYVYFNQNLEDFNIFDGIQIKDLNDNLVSSTGLIFNSTR